MAGAGINYRLAEHLARQVRKGTSSQGATVERECQWSKGTEGKEGTSKGREGLREEGYWG